MTEPESHPPEGAHMGTFMEDAHRTEVDLEDTGAALSQAQARIAKLEGRCRHVLKAAERQETAAAYKGWINAGWVADHMREALKD